MSQRLPSPAEAEIADIALALTARMAALERRSLKFSDFIGLLGQHSHTLLILVFSVLNMLPGPPGFGGTIALVIMTMAYAMARRRAVRLPRLIAERRLPGKLLRRLVKLLQMVTGFLARLSRPRLAIMTGPAAQAPTGMFIMALCVPMVVPVPFMNAIPNVGLTIICLSRLNRDGLGVILGVVIAVIGVIVDAFALWFLISLALQANHWFGFG